MNILPILRDEQDFLMSLFFRFLLRFFFHRLFSQLCGLTLCHLPLLLHLVLFLIGILIRKVFQVPVSSAPISVTRR